MSYLWTFPEEVRPCLTKYWKIYYSSPQPHGQPFWVQFLQASLCICWSELTRFRYFWFVRWLFLELRWFPSFALRIPSAHEFCVISARKWARARTKRKRFFPRTKLDNEINARFLLKEHGDPHFLFYIFNENNINNNCEKNWQKSMGTFLANEINATEGDVTGPTEQVQIMFPLKDKNIN